MGMRGLQSFQRVRVSTDEFPAAKRFAMWQEVYARGIFNVDIEPIGDAPFHAEVDFTLLQEVTIAAGSRSPATYNVTREHIQRSKDIIAISILRSGAASATQYGKELLSGVGSASVLMGDDPSSSTLSTDGTFITLALSRPAISALVPKLTSVAGSGISNVNPALNMLRRYVEFIQDGEPFADREIAHSVSTHILDLAALALGARGDAADLARLRGARAARFAEIKTDILSSLGDANLSTEAIAAKRGISSRYIRKLFEEDGLSFSTFVLAERLSRARRMLADRRYRHLSIAQLALECGFGDISYFNRCFRRRFGETPSDVREAARRGEESGV